MSWFGFGGSKKEESSSESVAPMRIDDDGDSHFPSSSTFDSNNFSSPSVGMGGATFEQQVMLEQQKAMIQAVMLKLTDVAFDKCITKPSTSLSYSEQSCIAAVTGKCLDTSEIVLARMQGAK